LTLEGLLLFKHAHAWSSMVTTIPSHPFLSNVKVWLATLFAQETIQQLHLHRARRSLKCRPERGESSAYNQDLHTPAPEAGDLGRLDRRGNRNYGTHGCRARFARVHEPFALIGGRDHKATYIVLFGFAVLGVMRTRSRHDARLCGARGFLYALQVLNRRSYSWG
jgi:hypothetical protein